MLKALIKKQLLELFQTYYINRKTGKARSKKGTILFFVLLGFLFLLLGLVFYFVSSSLGGVILGNGFNWLYFALMALLAMALGVFGSVFNTYASVYLPKDNELLLSLPIPNRTLLLARLSGVYITSLMYSAWVWIPALIAYWTIESVNALNILFPVLITFIIALFVAVLSCILGWVVALIASKAKGKSFITLFLSIAVFALYYVVYFKIVGSISEIMNHIGELEQSVKSWLHYSYLLGRAADGDALSMLLITLITAAAVAICFMVLSKSFTKLSTSGTGYGKKTKAPSDYTKKPLQTALAHREYKHFTSVSTWMLNGGFGLLLLPIAAVALIVKSKSIREILPVIAEELPQFYDLLPVLLLLTVCFVLSVNAILPVSVSMEGKTLWQLQSLPLKPWDILHAKERMNIQLCAFPSVFFILVCAVILKLHWWETVLICVAVLIYICAISDYDLFLNLKMPNFSWTNVASVTKQSAPVVISMFSGWALCAVLSVGSFFLARLIAAWAVLGVYILLFAVLWFVLNRWLKTKGTDIFASL